MNFFLPFGVLCFLRTFVKTVLLASLCHVRGRVFYSFFPALLQVMRGKLHKLAMILNATIKCKHEAEVSPGKFMAGLAPGASNTGYELTFPLNMTRH